jgi:hypothetical protein
MVYGLHASCVMERVDQTRYCFLLGTGTASLHSFLKVM